ncbi:sodium-dependent transporter [bacterium]|nr:sodium-dependent transporter [bacterium]
MAAAGSAVGLGNIWRFPYMAGKNGGAAFVLVYLIFVFVLGLPIMLTELVVGRRTQRDAVGAIKTLAPGTTWPVIGGLGVLTGFAILSFYSVIAGWTLSYVFKCVQWGNGNLFPADGLNDVFNACIVNPTETIGFLVVFMLLTMVVVAGGVKNGIERWSKILMPVLLLLLLLMIVRSLTLPGAMAGVSFYLKPDFSKITKDILIQALGQAFFSLSLGMGAMMTYGSYLSRKDNLVTSGVMVCVFDTLIALMAGLAIFPAVFALGQEPAQGPNLIFVVLPAIFAEMPGGFIVGIFFFILLAIAALTSTVSLLEVVTAYFVDERGWKRKRAVFTIGFTSMCCAVLAALSWGASDGLSNLPLLNIGFFDLLDKIFSTYSLAIGAFLLSFFVSWRWGLLNAIREIENGNSHFSKRKLLRIGSITITPAVIWGVLAKVIAPAGILILIIHSFNIGENYAIFLKVVSGILVEGTVFWLLIRYLSPSQALWDRCLLMPLIRMLILTLIAPLLMLIPVVGIPLAVIFAITVNFLLLRSFAGIRRQAFWRIGAIVTLLEIVVWYFFF